MVLYMRSASWTHPQNTGRVTHKDRLAATGHSTQQSYAEEVRLQNRGRLSRVEKVSSLHLGLVGLGVDVSQLLVDGHGLTELQRPLKHFL